MSAFTLCTAMVFIGLSHAAPSIVTILGLIHYPYLTRLSILLYLVLLFLKVTNFDIDHFITIPWNKYSRKYAPFRDADAALQHTNFKLVEAETTTIKNQEAHRVESFNAELQHITQMTEYRQAVNGDIRAFNQTVQRLNKTLAKRNRADALVQSDLKHAVEYSEDTNAALQETEAALAAEKRAHEALKQDKQTLSEVWTLTKKNTAVQYNFDICCTLLQHFTGHAFQDSSTLPGSTSKHAPPVLVDLEKFEAAYKRVEQQQIAEPKQKMQTALQEAEVEHKKELKHGKEMLALEVRKHFDYGLEEGRLSTSTPAPAPAPASSETTPARTRTTRQLSPTPRLLHKAGFESFTTLKDAFHTWTGTKVLRAGPFSMHIRSKARRSCQSGRRLLTDGSNAMALD